MLDGKVCVVTGAAQGMGRATAIEMGRRGARAVAVLDVQQDAGEETARLVRDTGATAEFVRCDLADAAQITRAIDQIADTFGGLDVLHNNAAVIDSAFTEACAFDALPEAVWDTVFTINVRAVWLATRAATPHLRRSSRGPAVVNAASVAGMVGYLHPAYAVSKAAIIQLTKVMAMDLAPEVRCNCYCPGTIDTEMYRHAIATSEDPHADPSFVATALLARPGTPEEVASLVCFLASDEAAYITGASYVIDGGLLAWRGARASGNVGALRGAGSTPSTS